MPSASRGRHQSLLNSTIFPKFQLTSVSNQGSVVVVFIIVFVVFSDQWLEVAGVCSPPVLTGGEGVSSATVQATAGQDGCVYSGC